MLINSIVAVGPNGEIGWRNRVPWFDSEDQALRTQAGADMQQFVKLTADCDLIAGYHTYVSILHGTSDEKLLQTGRRLWLWDSRAGQTPEQLIALIRADAYPRMTRDIWIVGGAKTYRAFDHLVNGARIISHVSRYVGPADTYYPHELMPSILASGLQEASMSIQQGLQGAIDRAGLQLSKKYPYTNPISFKQASAELAPVIAEVRKKQSEDDPKLTPLRQLGAELAPLFAERSKIAAEADEARRKRNPLYSFVMGVSPTPPAHTIPVKFDHNPVDDEWMKHWMNLLQYGEPTAKDDGFFYFNLEQPDGSVKLIKAWPVSINYPEAVGDEQPMVFNLDYSNAGIDPTGKSVEDVGDDIAHHLTDRVQDPTGMRISSPVFYTGIVQQTLTPKPKEKSMSAVRAVTDHIVPGDDAQQLTITVTDQPGAGGANHRYLVQGMNLFKNQSRDPMVPMPDPNSLEILFQNGPIKSHGVNGLTQEVLIAVCIDRLKGFQAGEFANDKNAEALEHLQAALKLLQQRTVDRIARGVEGTNQK